MSFLNECTCRLLIADMSDLSTASGALATVCSRVLHETREPEAAKLALGAVLYVVDASIATSPAPLPTGGGPDVAAVAHQLMQVVELSSGRRSELAAAFVRQHYSRWAATLFGPALNNWLGALTSAQVQELFDSHFLRAPPREAIEAIGAALQMPEPAGDGAPPTCFPSPGAIFLFSTHAAVFIALLICPRHWRGTGTPPASSSL